MGTIANNTTLDKVVQALRCTDRSCLCQRNGGNKYKLHCPAHDDHTPSLSVTLQESGTITGKCHGGCAQPDLIAKLTEMGLWEKRGVTLNDLAAAKRLPVPFLEGLGLKDSKRNGVPVVSIPYLENEEVVAVRYRTRLHKSQSGDERFAWRTGDKIHLYGLNRIVEIRNAKWVLLVEGESDCWAAWNDGLPALGVPGKTNWKSEWAKHLAGLKVYLWQEPDAADFTQRVAKDLPELDVIVAPDGIKDISDAHLQNKNAGELIAQLRKAAVPAQKFLQENAAALDLKAAQEKQARIEVEAEKAATILELADPLAEVDRTIKALGYGGDLTPAKIVYLSATSRVLEMRHGSMLVHILMLGAPSGGKSYTINTVRKLFPKDASHVIDAGSPRTLIYDESDLQHKFVLFSEADSLPMDEDNPAASALRNMLQDGHLHYQYVGRDEGTGKFTVLDIDKAGPTVLLTTAVKRLGPQLMTRLFTLEVPDDNEQIRAALSTQAKVEIEGTKEPDPALLSFQAYLQARAPWKVVVPFAKELAAEMGKSINAPRMLRDFARLLSLIKTVTVIRHRSRRVDPQGRLIATLEDYATVYDLTAQMYEESASQASKKARAAVECVEKMLNENKQGTEKIRPVTVSRVAKELGVSEPTAKRHTSLALEAGWLVNSETRKGYPAHLELGDPLPQISGLPEPRILDDAITLAQNGISNRHRESDPISSEEMNDGNAITVLEQDGGEGGDLSSTESDGYPCPPPSPQLYSSPVIALPTSDYAEKTGEPSITVAITPISENVIASSDEEFLSGWGVSPDWIPNFTPRATELARSIAAKGKTLDELNEFLLDLSEELPLSVVLAKFLEVSK